MASATDRFSRLAALRPAPGTEARGERTFCDGSQPRSADECELAVMLGATVSRTRFGNHLSVRNWHATPEFCAPSAGVVDLLVRSAGLKPARAGRAGATNAPAAESGPYKSPLAEDPEKWLFLDTETTGLAGGTGTYPFLIGIAWWDAGGLQVEQLLMRDFSEEHSVLLELAERIAERPVLVTFNGKTFDWPLLENRYLMTRSIQVPQLAAHLDLLHPARAVWKLRLGSVKLTELERHVLDAQRLGWDRADDVPSAMIPQFYFDYLRGASVAPLAGVVRHNRNDLRGLAAVFRKLNELLGNKARVADADGLDLFGLSRFLQRRGESERAESACAAAREAGLPIPFDAQAHWDLARMAKRRGEHEQAAKIWEQLSPDAEWRAAACEELALFHERRRRDFQTALKYARHAVVALRKRASIERYAERSAGELRQFERLTKRIARLEARAPKAENLPSLLKTAP